MAKDPPEIFDVEAIAARNIAEAKLRAKAFELALDIAKWHAGYLDGKMPTKELTKAANKLYAWFHTGDYLG
jgi:hypothetical protein